MAATLGFTPSSAQAAVRERFVLPEVRGTVYIGSRPVAMANVQVFAEPAGTALRTQQLGSAMKLQRVGTARTQTDGAYVAVLRDSSPLAADVNAAGNVNLWLIASWRGHFEPFAFCVHVGRPGSKPSPLSFYGHNGAAVRVPVHLSLRAKPMPGAATAGKSGSPTPPPSYTATTAPPVGTTGTSPTSSPPPPIATASSAASAPSGCNQTLVANQGVVPFVAAQTFSSFADVWTVATYQGNASSSLGVGVSASGSYGSFSVSGTNSSSSTVSESYSSNHGSINEYYTTYEQYAKYHVECPSGKVVEQYYASEPRYWAAGATQYAVSGAPTANMCVPQGAGTTFSDSTTRAITWSDGVNIMKYIGIDLSSQTGYSTTTTVSYHYTLTGRLCGIDSTPGGPDAYAFVAKA